MPINLSGNVSQALNAITAYNTKKIKENNQSIKNSTEELVKQNNALMKNKAAQAYFEEAWSKRNEKNSAFQNYKKTYEAAKKGGASEEDARKEAQAAWSMEAETGVNAKYNDMFDEGKYSSNIDKSINNFVKQAQAADQAKGTYNVQKDISKEIIKDLANGGNK